MLVKVIHCHGDTTDSSTTVYIGRGSKWGNPFIIGRDGTRIDVIEKYRKWIVEGDGRHLIDDLHELSGKRLACWCAPLQCHGDVLKQLVESVLI